MAAAAAASAAAGAVVGSAPLTDPIPTAEAIEQTDLPNGLRIVTETMPEARSVTLGAWVGVGGRDEPAELSGASHFLEHLLFKGTEERSARAHRGDRRRGRRRDERVHRTRAHRVLRPAPAPAPRARAAAAGRRAHGTGAASRGHRRRAPGDRRGDPHEPRLARGSRPHAPRRGGVRRPPARARRARRHGHRGGPRVTPRSAASSTSWYRPGTLVLAAAGRLEHADAGPGRGGAFGHESGGGSPERQAPAAVEPDGGRRPRRHRAGPPLPRLAQPDGHRPGPLRDGRGQPGARRGHGQPAVPGGPRGAGAGLRRVLPPERVHGQRLPHDLLRHRAEAGSRDPGGDRGGRGRRCWPTGSPSASSRSPPATSRARCCSASRTAADAWPASAEAWCSRAGPSTVDEQVASITAVTRDDVHRVLCAGCSRDPGPSPPSGPFEADALA